MNEIPSHRRLRAYTFDPSLTTKLDTAFINQSTIKVPWEDDLKPGPVGEYLEVIDIDPASGLFYEPVDLNAPHLLAQDGLAPSEGNPQFHQQMVYAVASKTIDNFEQALGRKALWAPHICHDEGTGQWVSAQPVPRLRIYPHALREANAYYSPDKKALLFGYFPATLSNDSENLPGGMVFTCLSQDVVAHETTHALLDGLHRYFAEPSNPDVLGFHEAFADLVALFQHFTQPEALRHQISRTRGDLATQNLLGELAHQFGQAIGSHGALRDAIGHYDEEQLKWVPEIPDPDAYGAAREPHDRGQIFVAAVFDAFLAIYKRRTADLTRIATSGTGVLPEGQLHPDLVNRLAREATKAAGHVLRMVIRALDYCPPVDITFGEYLRALVTADYDLFPDDPLGYRIAMIEGFRRRGIYPPLVRSLASDALRWQPPGPRVPSFRDLLSTFKTGRLSNGQSARYQLPDELKDVDVESLISLEWQASESRDNIERLNQAFQKLTWWWIRNTLIDPATGLERDRETSRQLGLILDGNAVSTISRRRVNGNPTHEPTLEIHSVRTCRRPTQSGRTKLDLVVEMTQRRRGYLDPELQKRADHLPPDARWWEIPALKKPDFMFRGGCTLLIDSETGEARYTIYKCIDDEARFAAQRDYHSTAAAPSLRATYGRALNNGLRTREPFAVLHRSR